MMTTERPNLNPPPKGWLRYIETLEQDLQAARAAQQLAEQQTQRTFTRPGNSAAPSKVYALPGDGGLSKDFQPLAHGTEIEWRHLFDDHGTTLSARINGGYSRSSDKDWLEISADTSILIKSAASNRVLIRAEGYNR